MALLDLDDRTRRALWLALAVLAGFVTLDALVVHPRIWMNDPALGYWIAKPIYVGVPLLAGTYLLTRWGVPLGRAVAVGGLAGIVALQVYYTVVPVPLEGGGELALGLVPNLTGGLVVHYGALAVALVAVLVGLTVYRRLDT